MNTLLRECLVQFRSQLIKEQLIDEKAIFIDGIKIEANANKYTFVWKKSIDNFDKSLTKKSMFIYDEFVKNEIIPEIERDSQKELSVSELGKIEEQLVQVVDKFTKKLNRKKRDTLEKNASREAKSSPKKYETISEFQRKKSYLSKS